MAIKLSETEGGKVWEIHLSGKIVHEDYVAFVPEFERLVRLHGKLRVLFDMTDFHGWEVGALWDDIKFDIKHFADIEQLAIVGDKEWEKQMSLFCRPFTTAKIRYFDHAEAREARVWLKAEPIRV